MELVKHCTGVAEVMGSDPIQVWIFFKALLFAVCKTKVPPHSFIPWTVSQNSWFLQKKDHIYKNVIPDYLQISRGIVIYLCFLKGSNLDLVPKVGKLVAVRNSV